LVMDMPDYNIPSNNRELQLQCIMGIQ